jgi:hypothetical protein
VDSRVECDTGESGDLEIEEYGIAADVARLLNASSRGRKASILIWELYTVEERRLH